jgi:hypothetical protein
MDNIVSGYSLRLIPTLSLNKIKIKLSIGFFCLSCRIVHCQCDCLLVYSHCPAPKCCVHDTTVSTYVAIILIFDCGWMCLAPKLI